MTEIPTTGLVNFSSGNLTSLTRRTLIVVARSTWNWKETGRNFPHEWQVQLGDRDVTSALTKFFSPPNAFYFCSILMVMFRFKCGLPDPGIKMLLETEHRSLIMAARQILICSFPFLFIKMVSSHRRLIRVFFGYLVSQRIS